MKRKICIQFVTAIGVLPALSISLLTGCSHSDQKTDSTIAVPKTSSLPSTSPNGSSLDKTTSLARTDRSVGAEKADSNSKTIEKIGQIIKQAKLPDSAIICSINGVPLTMGEYHRQFKVQEQQLQTSLTMNSNLKDRLLALAKERGITLSAEEKKRLMDTSNQVQVGGKKGFGDFLKKNQLTKNEFNAQVLDVGLACKAANGIIEENLFREMLNRELISQAATKDGFSKQALKKYTELKKAPQYQEVLVASGMTADEVRDEFIKNQLCKMELDKIKNQAKVTETDLRHFFDENKSKLIHGTRIRLSQIVIAAPSQDTGTMQSVRTQILKNSPKLSTVDLDKHVKEATNYQHQKAEKLLERALKGTDFAQLANEYTDDLPTRKAKLGGDMGFQDEDKLIKSFTEKVKPLKVGQICPEVIETPFGFHIVKVTGKEEAGTYKFDEVKNDLSQLLTQKKAEEVVAKWISDEQSQAKIEPSNQLRPLISSNEQDKITNKGKALQ